MMVKLPRKNAVHMIEAEQAKLTGLINDTRAQIKQKTSELLKLSPNISDMDPYTVKLLLAEQKKEKKKEKGEEEGESDQSD